MNLVNHLATFSPISTFQQRSMPNRSITSALCTLTHDCLIILMMGKKFAQCSLTCAKQLIVCTTCSPSGQVISSKTIYIGTYPLWWIPIYMNDIVARVSPSSKLVFFADDIALYHSITLPAYYMVLQLNITSISVCMGIGKLVNSSCKMCCYTI